jgi:hypothetical protein
MWKRAVNGRAMVGFALRRSKLSAHAPRRHALRGFVAAAQRRSS